MKTMTVGELIAILSGYAGHYRVCVAIGPLQEGDTLPRLLVKEGRMVTRPGPEQFYASSADAERAGYEWNEWEDGDSCVAITAWEGIR
jgi:hypothetical protein